MSEIIVVIGMGRSGTALTCQVLEELGVSFGRPEHLVGPTPFNERGHYDHGPIHDLNIDILKRLFNVVWLYLGELAANWHTWPAAEPFRKRAAAILCDELEHANGLTLGIKDPRITRMQGFWNDVFASVGVTPRYVLCWRHPEHVYLSCHPRKPHEVTADEGDPFFRWPENPNVHRADMFAIWAHYMQAGFDAQPEAVIKYDNWFLAGWAEKQMRALAAVVGVEPISAERLGEIVNPAMRHFGPGAA